MLRHLGPPAGNGTISLRGSAHVPPAPPIDPAAKGLRLVLTGAHGEMVLDAMIPPGPYDSLARVGWNVNGTRTSWRYRNANGVAGLTNVRVSGDPASGHLAFSARGAGSCAVPQSAIPLTLTLVIDAPTAATAQCAEKGFAPGRCRLDRRGSSLHCR